MRRIAGPLRCLEGNQRDRTVAVQHISIGMLVTMAIHPLLTERFVPAWPHAHKPFDQM